MWRPRRRIRQLEDEVASAKAGQDELRRRLHAFEMIAGAAGAALPAQSWWDTTESSGPIPPSLAAAANTVAAGESPVRLVVDGNDVIAVIGGPGNPREWWSAVRQLAGHLEEAS